MLEENRPVELLTFVFLFLGGILGLLLAVRAKRRGWGNVAAWFYLFFSIGMIFTAMEEVAWGQWFFGFQTPAMVREINAQGEFTLHNVRGLQGHSEFFRVTFGIGGLIGVAFSSHKSLWRIGAPEILVPWFAVITMLAAVDLFNDYVPIHDGFDFMISRLAELVEMMIGVAGFLYVWLNGRMLSAWRAEGIKREGGIA